MEGKPLKNAVIVVNTDEDLDKVNDQLTYFCGTEPMENKGGYPRYFKITDDGMEEIVDNNGSVTSNKDYFFVSPA